MAPRKVTKHPADDITRILQRPYARAIFPDEDGSYFGEVIEFPGCFAAGATAAEALGNLEEVAHDWLRIELEKGHAIPQPMGSSDYSGKLVLRIPRGLHRKAAWAAEREGVSLNQFIGTCVAECVGERRTSPVTTISVVAIGQSALPTKWATLTNNFITKLVGELTPVENHA